MSGRQAPLAAVLVFAACATAAPAPEPSEAPPPPAPDAAAPVQDAGVPAPRMSQEMGRMHRGGMMGDSAAARGREMGGMHRQGMGQGRGMQGEGEGMHGRREGGMGLGRMGPTEPRDVPADLQEGERIYREICSLCHTMDPPANLAPPMSHVARHLRQSFADEESAVAHVVDYLPAPAAERSIMPEMARERFGLMPPQPLPRNLLEAVGRYVWFLGSPQ